jgi:predicted ABC-type ATPase
LNTKELLVVGGPNGSGKSTFVAEYLQRHPRPYLCADLIATELTHLDEFARQIEAGREFLRRIEQQLATGESFIIESTLSGRTLRNFLSRAQDAGYSISFSFVYLDSPDSCIDRVHQRVRRGGHNVPVDDIRRRFTRSCANFWHIYRQIAGIWVVYYNASSEFVEVAFGCPDGFVVGDEALFRRYLEFAGAEEHG